MKRVVSIFITVIFYWGLLILATLSGCKEENFPPEAILEVTPLTGEVPVEVTIKLTGEDPDGIGDITQYILTIGSEIIKSQTPIDITRTFNATGTINIYGEVVDSKNQRDRTTTSSVQAVLGPYIDQSVSLSNEVELSYSATLHKVVNAELKVNRGGILFLTVPITDVNSSGVDYQKTFKFSPDNITKGIYQFLLKSGELEKSTSVEVPNYKPTANLSGLETNLMEGTEIQVNLPVPLDKNPEDNPVAMKSATSLDGKTQVTLNGYVATIKALKDKVGSYQVEVEFGSTAGGLEKAVLTGNIAEDTRWVVNPFVQPNDSTLNWYGSGDVNKDNVVNSQDLTRIIELIAGTYSNPGDTRLNDRADVNGDGVVNNSDRQLLENKLNGTLSYLPGEWNKLITKTERVNWLTKMLEIDKTDDLQYIPGEWVCGNFANQIIINFHGFGELGFEEELGLKDNGRFNIPVNFVAVVAPGFGHAINWTITGNNLENFQDGTYTEPQTDWVVYPGMYNGFPANCELEIKMPFNKNRLDLIAILKFKIENTVPTLTWINEDPNLNIIKQR